MDTNMKKPKFWVMPPRAHHISGSSSSYLQGTNYLKFIDQLEPKPL